MNYLPMMTEDEIQYICSVIPLQETIVFFKRYPKDFAKIMPGFRATSLKRWEQVSALLFRSRNQLFISSFIEKHISRWLSEINDSITQRMEAGDSKEFALLHTLPLCFFIDNIGLYFKLVGEEHPEEYITFVGASIKTIKVLDVKREKLETILEDKISEAKRLESELERIQFELAKTDKKLRNRSAEISVLRHASAELEKLKINIQSNEQIIDGLRKNLHEQEDHIRQLKTELSAAKDEQQKLEIKIREELEKEQATKIFEQGSTRRSRHPRNIEDFKDYLGYNLENIGVPTNEEYFPLLKDYLGDILFHGKPILVGRNVGVTLMKCISNALVGAVDVETFAFTSNVTEKTIDKFLSINKRIVCLDNFIGNFNETILLTICDQHKDKIIFLTMLYDRTLRYVPEEFMKHCYYLNLNRIETFISEKELTEDPSTIDESEVDVSPVGLDIRWSTALKEILEELGVRGALSAHKRSIVPSELGLCRLLAFDILPYCTDVLKIAPFTVSERLVKYAGNSGRCPYKDLFRKWFI